MTITPVNGFILLKQKEKNMEGKIVYQGDKHVCENEFEVIAMTDLSSVECEIEKERIEKRGLVSVGDIIIKGPHSGDRITVDDEEFWIIKSDHILAIKN